mmetsp:Transcript_47746/g.93252  ORF Transcript_47746/g.93252 Transcript_47746/m.93252 type:complete len:304 (-) Transcript_47746:9-920(-)
MAAVHETEHGHARLQGQHELFEQFVVPYLPRVFVIDRDQGFVVAVVFVAVVVRQFAAVARIVAEHGIAGLAFLRDSGVGLHDVPSVGAGVVAVVHQHLNIFLLEAVHVHDIPLDVLHVVVTPAELARLSDVIDPDQHGAFRPPVARLGEFEGVRQIELAGRRELRHLRVVPLQLHPHAAQHVHPGHLRRGHAVVVEDVQQGGRAGASGFTGRVRQLEFFHVGHVGAGLAIGAARDHADFGRDQLLRLLLKSHLVFILLQLLSGREEMFTVHTSVSLSRLKQGIRGSKSRRKACIHISFYRCFY